MSAHPQSLLVTGAGGQLGQRVLAHLLDTLQLPPARIVALTRRPETLAAWAARGVEVRPGDFDAPASLDAAFQGVGRLLLISTDAFDRPGHRLVQHQAAIAAAVRSGVQHVVYTSCPEPYDSPLLIAADHAGTEDALAASALPGWTVLRNHWYLENLFLSLPSILASGRWYSATGDGRSAHIARDDLARAAAAALAGGGAAKRTLTLSGDRAYSTAEIAALVAQTVGTPIQVIQVPVEGLIQGMVAAGLPEPVARMLASFDSNTAAGRVAGVTGDYQALTGQAPQPFEQWLQVNRAQLAALAP
ncbi:SDR family oxidoreductase [Xanthomonas hyacinthi]|uniref:NAD(P)-dependent oxidoreductase n=1 Tax=Xanthomonas hyacinthi TaxID=56455 RepID=A0A2S7EYU8_9XANT|nr:SDR family oxidoreductase [Xanthomonas hyacinthi]KLD76809.1 nucleoside-diphosphate sugar epimerase [Xanthomonas hyacinthi DSM 19077]PPU98265.1 NAD(P)-dependent oxidoreductase [Xanthomonas hyacinthi]QGY76740.1 SDR family oxidoreductase [Xanthomonas hyacinthi]